MDKRKLNWVTMAFVVLTVLVVALMLSNTLRRSSHIILPETGQTTEQQTQNPGEGSALTVVEIAPNTVQAAIQTLARPESYCRTVTVEQIWSGGSGINKTSVAVHEKWTRTDRTLPDGQVRHAITDGETTYVWYNDDQRALELSAGGISADNEQAIPTYEDVLELPADEILEADYREISGLRCIYVETKPDDTDYVSRYWVSVDSGLLVAAERLLDGVTVYRMGALGLDEAEPDTQLFTLPGGKRLI